MVFFLKSPCKHSFVLLPYYRKVVVKIGLSGWSHSLCGVHRHTDAGCITVLRQYAGEPSSLQVLSGGSWRKVVPAPGALTINIGDMMQVLSNGRYQAPLHRVLGDAARTRYSAPFFFNPSYEAILEPVLSGEREEPRYAPLPWGEFRRKRFEGDLGDQGVAEVQISDFCLHPSSALGRSSL